MCILYCIVCVCVQEVQRLWRWMEPMLRQFCPTWSQVSRTRSPWLLSRVKRRASQPQTVSPQVRLRVPHQHTRTLLSYLVSHDCDSELSFQSFNVLPCWLLRLIVQRFNACASMEIFSLFTTAFNSHACRMLFNVVLCLRVLQLWTSLVAWRQSTSQTVRLCFYGNLPSLL